MDLRTRQHVEALRRPLELAARDGFTGLTRITGLGAALRAACDRVLSEWPDNTPLRRWRDSLTEFERLSVDDQAVVVARGLRLVAGVARPPTPPVARSTRMAAVPPAPMVPGLATARAPAVPVRPGPAPAAPAPVAAAPAAATTPALAAPAPTAATAPATAPPAPAPAPVAAAAAAARRPRAPRVAAAPAPGRVLDRPVSAIRGIGPAFAAALAERGILTVEDLLWLVPRRYDDARAVAGVATALAAGDGAQVVVAGTIRAARMVYGRGRRWFDATIGDDDAGAALQIRWFGAYGSMAQRLPVGARAVLAGRLRVRAGRGDLANPDVLAVIAADGSGGDDAGRIILRYPDIPGLPPARLATACQRALDLIGAEAVEDGVPAEVAAAAGLSPLAEALAALHRPEAPSADEVAALSAGTSRWHRRVAFGELFELATAVEVRRRLRRLGSAPPYPVGSAGEVERALPFAPTAAQRRVFAEVGADLAAPVPMNRLLQGDVGSGKTAVLFAAAVQVARGGGQTAIMAPTEILAEQHAATLGRWAGPLGLRVALLTASTPRGARQSLLAMAAAGAIDLVVGTHALLAEGVGFQQLGLVVIDEQHRFGVAQRVRLRGKGDAAAPHLLVATATPIPRTLALTTYGDLDVSVLDELPPGRVPVTTEVVTGARGRATAIKALRAEVAAGGRAYVVCPRVEPPEPDDDGPRWADATTVAAELATALAPTPVGLAHGRMDGAERDAALAALRAGTAPVLVATTIIEVGVDVPEATLIVIEDADHFGLAQLHQLRGRVGRGGGAARCLLLTRGQATIDGGQRLAVMAATHDGFVIAERDLELRGPGELLGARQAGLPQLRFGDVAAHTQLLLEARAAAAAVLAADPELVLPAHERLRMALSRRGGDALFGAEGG